MRAFYLFLRLLLKTKDQSCTVDLRAFSPRPADFHPRPAPLGKAPPRTSLVGIIPKRAPDDAGRDVDGLGSIRHVRTLTYCICLFVVVFFLFKYWASTQSIAFQGSGMFWKDCLSLKLEFIRKPLRLVVMQLTN